MHVTILGSGSVVPTAERRQAAYLVQQDGFNVLLDAGPGTLHALARLGLPCHELHGVLLSHLHPDHALDVAYLSFLRAVAGELPWHDQLVIGGPPGFAAELRTWLEAIHPPAIDGRVGLTMLELETYPQRLGPWQARAVPVEHRRGGPSGSVGLALASDDGEIAYTGDSALCRGLNDLLARRGCLLCECTAPDSAPAPGHMTPSQVRRLVQRCPPELLVLTHLSPQLEPGELPGAAFDRYPGRVVVARDEMQITIDRAAIRTFTEPRAEAAAPRRSRSEI